MTLKDKVIANALNLGLTEENLKAGIKNYGNTACLNSFFNKARNGEALTVGYFGGSVTEGANSTEGRCYARNVTDWLRENFPKAQITEINGGKGATGSLVGCHRMDGEFLSHKPDLVFIDFSVNDALEKLRDGVEAKASYEGVVRKAIDSGSAVVIFCVCNQDKLTLQNLHCEIGKHYSLPVISMVDSIYPLIENGKMQWTDYSNDSVHPVNYGHSLLSSVLEYYLSDTAQNSKEEKDSEMPEALYSDVFQSGKMWDFFDAPVTDLGDFTVYNEFHQFTKGWSNSGSRPLKFQAENVREIHLIILYAPDENLGSALVTVGEQETQVSCYFENGWGEKALAVNVFSSPVPQNVTVTVSPQNNKSFKILRICEA